MSAFDSPSATSATTSRCRGVSAAPMGEVAPWGAPARATSWTRVPTLNAARTRDVWTRTV